MIERINADNILRASEAFSSSWRFSHNGVVSDEELDSHSPEYMRGVLLKLEEDGDEVFSYEKDNISLGIISFSPENNHISKLYVNPAYLRRGVGKRLVDFAISRMDSEKRVTVYCLDVNTRAIAFYLSLGFKDSGERAHTDVSGAELKIFVYEVRR